MLKRTKNQMFRALLDEVSQLPMEIIMNKPDRAILWRLFFDIDDSKLPHDPEGDFNKTDALFVLKELLFENLHAKRFECKDDPSLDIEFSSDQGHFNLYMDL
jgi:hypothetical protein